MLNRHKILIIITFVVFCPSKSSAQLLTEAKTLIESRKYDRAEFFLDSIAPLLSDRKDSIILALENYRIAVWYQNDNEYDKAIKRAGKAKIIYEKLNEKQGEIFSLIAQSHFSWMLGRYTDCLEKLNKSLAIGQADSVQKKYPRAHFNIIQRLGIVEKEFANYDLALFYFKQCYNFFDDKNLFFDLGASAFNMATVYLEMGQYTKAEEYFRLTIDIAPKMEIQPNDRKKAALTMLAELYRRRGELPKAIEFQLKAVRELSYDLSQADETYQGLGFLYLQTRQVQEAIHAFQKSIKYKNKPWGSISGLALSEEALGNMHNADSLYQSSVSAAESKAKFTQGSATIALSKKLLPVYEQAARFYWRIGKPERAFELLETGRARYLFQLLNLANVKSEQSVFTDSIKNIERQIGELYRKPESGSSTNQLEILVLEAAREQLLDSIKKYAPQFYAFKKTKILTLQELQTGLGSEFQLIEYAVMDDSIFVLTVNSEKASGHVIQVRRDSLERMIDRVITAERPSLNELRELYSLLVEPIEKNLQAGKTLILIPDDALFRLPFEMLVKKHDGNYRSAKYLLRDYPVSYAVSASVWLDRLNRYSNAPENYAGFAATVFDTLPSLPFAEHQTDQASDQFFSSSSWTNEKNMRDIFINRAGQFKIIDLATHAFVSDIEPMRSKIVFKEHDAVINAFEIYELDLDADLAVLSACGTGLGKLSAGEGFMGFNQAFSYAGVYSLILSMWNVDDESTQLILKVFYEKLAAGMPRSHALQEAKLEYLSNGYELKLSPRYWAGLTLWGNPQRVALNERPYGLWILCFSVMVLVMIGFHVNKKKKTPRAVDGLQP